MSLFCGTGKRVEMRALDEVSCHDDGSTKSKIDDSFWAADKLL